MNKVLKIVGSFLIILIIALCIPMSVPKLFGVQEYNVISGSMEPTIPVNSLCFVKEIAFDELKEQDVIAFSSNASVITHRAVEIDRENMLITTKGDANESVDFMPVSFEDVYGKVVLSIPVWGKVADGLSTMLGKVLALVILVLGIVMCKVADTFAGPTNSNTAGNKDNNKNVELTTAGSEDNNKNVESTTESKQVSNNGATKKKPSVLIPIAGVAIVLLCTVGAYVILSDYSRSNAVYADINSKYISYENTPDWAKMCQVDLPALSQRNSDCAGYLYVENTDISYPIMYSGDDAFYLHKDFNKADAKAGSIFLEGMNTPDFSDSHTLVYGHNMRNLSMFGSLKYFKSEENYLDSHQYFQITTPEGKFRYQIFSYFDTPVDSWVYAVPFEDCPEFEDYIAELKNKSYQPIDCDVKSADKIVTLSTCSTSGMRFVVNGVLVDVAK